MEFLWDTFCSEIVFPTNIEDKNKHLHEQKFVCGCIFLIYAILLQKPIKVLLRKA